ncbi:uncharacterized protein LOC110818244 isoform X2 [Carica papaya]|uniref:uncharacterized protein LOC110818244 isoform X2 n=1 Tax=Carica papaya TaxID=3649 RepID=UPI000B8CACB5|nr:uncharacterized protein LOC110818244 isoform X2 [Carica papaya]
MTLDLLQQSKTFLMPWVFGTLKVVVWTLDSKYLVGNLLKRKERSLFQWLSTRTTCATRNPFLGAANWSEGEAFLSVELQIEGDECGCVASECDFTPCTLSGNGVFTLTEFYFIGLSSPYLYLQFV